MVEAFQEEEAVFEEVVADAKGIFGAIPEVVVTPRAIAADCSGKEMAQLAHYSLRRRT